MSLHHLPLDKSIFHDSLFRKPISVLVNEAIDGYSCPVITNIIIATLKPTMIQHYTWNQNETQQEWSAPGALVVSALTVASRLDPVAKSQCGQLAIFSSRAESSTCAATMLDMSHKHAKSVFSACCLHHKHQVRRQVVDFHSYGGKMLDMSHIAR
jgi:hypothetical protein